MNEIPENFHFFKRIVLPFKGCDQDCFKSTNAMLEGEKKKTTPCTVSRLCGHICFPQSSDSFLPFLFVWKERKLAGPVLRG